MIVCVCVCARARAQCSVMRTRKMLQAQQKACWYSAQQGVKGQDCTCFVKCLALCTQARQSLNTLPRQPLLQAVIQTGSRCGTLGVVSQIKALQAWHCTLGVSLPWRDGPAPCAKLLNACAELYKLQATSATLPVLKDDTEVQYCCLQKGCRTGCESSAARVLSWFCVVTCFLPTTCGQPDSAPLVLGQAMCYVYWWGMCSSGPKNQW